MSSQESFVALKPSEPYPRWVYACDYKVVDRKNMYDALREIAKSEHIAWDSEFEFTHHGHIVHAYSFSTKPQTGWMIPVRMDHITNLPMEVVSRFLRAIALKENNCQNQEAERRSVASDFADDFEAHCAINHDIQNVWFLRDPNESKDFKENKAKAGGVPQGFSQDAMARKYLRIEAPSLKNYFDAGHRFCELEYHAARLYSCADSDICRRLFKLGADPSIIDSFPYKLDMSLLPVLQDMEDTGIYWDGEIHPGIEKELTVLVDEARIKAYDVMRIDPTSNIDSSTQLARHITNVLQWPKVGGVKKRKDGLNTTEKRAMERYAEHPDSDISSGAQAYLAYKGIQTLLTRSVQKLPDYVNPVTNAIHCSFLSTVVPTGRLASAGPNLQNVPKKRKDGRAPVRRLFRARPGHIFLEADYSQIELRVLAGESDEPFLKDAFAAGEDLHTKAARQIFGRDEIDDDERQVGKMINFGLVYQMEASGFAARTDFTVEQSQRFIDDYFAGMPYAVAWIQKVINDARQQGGVHTHFGRWRPLDTWLKSRNPADQSFGERSAINTVVQGTAADIMKIALVRVHKAIKQGKIKARMILTVHDSLLLEIPEDTDLKIFVPELEKLFCFKVENYPDFKIDCKVGPNWYDMTPYEPEMKVESKSVEPVTKELPLHPCVDEVKLLSLLRDTSTGHITVKFIRPNQDLNGKTPGIKMDNQGYQRVLQFLVAQGRMNGVAKSEAVADPDQDTKLPDLQFA